jgi:hypothetical protein
LEQKKSGRGLGAGGKLAGAGSKRKTNGAWSRLSNRSQSPSRGWSGQSDASAAAPPGTGAWSRRKADGGWEQEESWRGLGARERRTGLGAGCPTARSLRLGDGLDRAMRRLRRPRGRGLGAKERRTGAGSRRKAGGGWEQEKDGRGLGQVVQPLAVSVSGMVWTERCVGCGAPGDGGLEQKKSGRGIGARERRMGAWSTRKADGGAAV